MPPTPPISSRRCDATRDELDGFLEFLAGEIAHPGLAAVVGARPCRQRSPSRPSLAPGGGRRRPPRLRGRPARAHRRGRDALPRDGAAPSAPPHRPSRSPRRSLHDLGRTRELERGPAFRQTDEGRLLGHVHLGLRLIEERVDLARRRRPRRAPPRGRLPPRPPGRADGRGRGALPREPARRAGGDPPRRRRLTGRDRSPSGPRRSGAPGDFLGGLTSRKAGVLTVLLWSQLAGALGLAVWVATAGDAPPGGVAVLAAVGAGLAGVIGLACLYRGMAIGAMGVVAPISATSPVVALAVDLARGRSPGWLQWIGIACALGGIVLLSRERSAGRMPLGAGVGLALVAALGFGFFVVAPRHRRRGQHVVGGRDRAVDVGVRDRRLRAPRAARGQQYPGGCCPRSQQSVSSTRRPTPSSRSPRRAGRSGSSPS